MKSFTKQLIFLAIAIGIFVCLAPKANALTGSFAPGKFGSGYDFKNSDSIDVGDAGSDIRTVSFWVKLNSATEKILELNTATYVEASSAVVSASGFTSPAIYVNAVQTTAISAGSWQFVAITTNTSINGSAVSLGVVGADSLDGVLDDVRFYNYSQTQKQIISDMNAGHPAVGSPVGSYVGYWDFNEAYGTTAYDKSGNNNDGAITGADWTMNGKFGGALDFEADNSDYVNLGNNASLNITGPITISAWVKRESIDVQHAIIGKWKWSPGNLRSYYLQIFSDNKAQILLSSDGTDAGTTNIKSVSTISAGQWYHLVGVYDGSYMRIYVNGVQENSIAYSLGIFSNQATKVAIGIQNYDGTPYNYFDGLIDEVKIYPFALSPAEIKQEYNQGKTMVLGSPRNSASTWDDGGFGGAAPVAIWKMDEKTGQYAYDVSPNENTGTLGSTSGSDANDPSWKSAGECKKGSCLSFDGTDDYVKAGDAGLPTGANSRTAEFWVKRASSANFTYYPYPFFYGTKTTYNGFGFYGSINTTDMWFYGHSYDFDTGIDLNDTLWHYIVLTFDGTNLRAYKDSVLISTTDRGSLNTILSDYDFTIGSFLVTDQYWNGLIDDIRIYNYARTPAQIAWDYNSGKPKLRFKFDENTGATAYDYYKTKNGTITGADWTGGADQCKFNYCLDFIPANSDYVDVGDTGIGANLYSVSFWIYPDSIASQNIIDFDGGTRKITTDGSGNLSANGWSSPTYYKNGIQTASPVLTASTWQHITITTATAFNPNDVDFGRVSTNYFNGRLDEIKFYTYPLTAAQVKQDYQGGALRIGPGEGLP